MLSEYQTELSELLVHDEGMLTGDDSGFPKKGNNSVGVARQYCGNTGKVDNCQNGVMVGYASPRGYGLVLSRTVFETGNILFASCSI